MIHIHLPSVEEFLAAATPDTRDITRIKRQALRQMEAKVMKQRTKPDRTSDRFVAWKFKNDWANLDLPLGTIAGTDLDYFDAAAQDCIELFHTWGYPGSIDPDQPGRQAFGSVKGGSVKYNAHYALWQNRREVQSPHGLTGPWVDFAPTVDYALFLEKSATTNTNNLNAPLLRGIGVLHAIAERLQTKYARVMRIFAHTQVPKSGNSIAERRGNIRSRRGGGSGPVRTFPVIRIMHRHYR